MEKRKTVIRVLLVEGEAEWVEHMRFNNNVSSQDGKQLEYSKGTVKELCYQEIKDGNEANTF